MERCEPIHVPFDISEELYKVAISSHRQNESEQYNEEYRQALEKHFGIKKTKEAEETEGTEGTEGNRRIEADSGSFLFHPNDYYLTKGKKYQEANEDLIETSEVSEDVLQQLKEAKNEQQRCFWTAEECNYIFKQPDEIFSDKMEEFFLNIALSFPFVDIVVKDSVQDFKTFYPQLEAYLSAVEYIETIHKDAYNQIGIGFLDLYDKFKCNGISTVNEFQSLQRDLNLLKNANLNVFGIEHNLIDFSRSTIHLLNILYKGDNQIVPFYNLLQVIDSLPVRLKYILTTFIEVQLLTTFTVIDTIAQGSANDAITSLIEVNDHVSKDETIHVTNAITIIKDVLLNGIPDEVFEDVKDVVIKYSLRIIHVFQSLYVSSIKGDTIVGIPKSEFYNLYQYNAVKFFEKIFGVLDDVIPYTEPIPEMTLVHETEKKHNFFERKGLYSEQGCVDLKSHLVERTDN